MRGPLMLGVVAALVVVGAVGVSGGVPPRHNELVGYTFGRYMEDFGKGYERGTAEYARRERLFLREVEAVRRHNAGGRATYKKGVNRYSDWTVEEKRRLRGVVGVGGARGAMGVGGGCAGARGGGGGPAAAVGGLPDGAAGGADGSEGPRDMWELLGTCGDTVGGDVQRRWRRARLPVLESAAGDGVHAAAVIRVVGGMQRQ